MSVGAIVKEPIYFQLNGQLRQMIVSGECRVGSKFLTERQISERFGVSRPTANKALSNLVSEGLLEFRKGVGTFVRGRPIDYNLRALVSFTEEAIEAGRKPSTSVLLFQQVQAGDVLDDVPEILHAAPDSALYYMERLRLADGVPVILEKRYVVGRHCLGLRETDVGGSLYQLWTGRFGLAIEGADESIRAVNLRGADARILEVRDGAAGMLVTSVGYLIGGEPLWSERTLYRGDAYEFRNRLGGLQPAGRAPGKFLGSAYQIDGKRN